LHYREEFSGLAVLNNKRSETSENKIDFSVERTPFGTKEVEIKFSITPDFPVITAIRNLKEFILIMEKEGKLI
ncbi:MAG: hypothetical protein KAH95_05885, partial [Spirochaetales bacterium]|nr:hypothetical protein [Spirochaetales bacterium]